MTPDPLAVLHNRATRERLGGPPWLKLRAEPWVVKSARRFVVSLLRNTDPEHVDAVDLATSELVTNALKAAWAFADRMGIAWGYQATPVHVRVLVTDRLVRLDVRDPDPAMPERRPHDLMDESGRGLDILDELAVRVWPVSAAYYKTMHAVIAAPGVELGAEEIESL